MLFFYRFLMQLVPLVVAASVFAGPVIAIDPLGMRAICETNLQARTARLDAEPVYGYFEQPSPGRANAGLEAFTLSSMVAFSEPARTFTGSFTLTLSGAEQGEEIRYTTNGSVPTRQSALYTGPLVISATTYLRARIFDDRGVGGAIAGRHYLRIAANLANRQSNLPMVVLDTRGQSLNASTRRPAIFKLFDRDATGASALANLPDLSTRQGLRWRGSSSLSQPKKPYSVEFWDETDEEIRHPVLGMTAESDWVFYAPYDFDRAYIRNSVAYELSRRIGRWAPQTRFVEVFLNADGADLTAADYVGVYAIIEQVKMNARRLGFRTVNPWDVPPPGPIDPTEQGSWTGGYLFKIDRTDNDEYDWRTQRGVPTNFHLTLSRPKMRNLDGGPYFSNSAALNGSGQVQYLRSYVQAFEDALHADAASSFAQRSYLNWIERDSFIDHLVINAFTKNVDALRLSAFFHKPENELLRAGPVWDFDRSMDSYDWRDDAFNTWNGGGDATRYFERDWWGVLAPDPDFRQAFYDRWAELRSGAFAPAGISDVILNMGTEIHDSSGGHGSAADRDAARWTANTPRRGGYPAEIDHIHNWMQSRANWMDRRRTDGGLLPQPPRISVLHGESGTDVTLSVSGGTAYVTTDGSDPRAPGGAIAGVAYSGTFRLTDSAEVVARVRDGTGHWSTPSRLNLLPDERGALFLPIGTAIWQDNAHWDSSPSPYPDAPMAVVTIPPPGGEVNRAIQLQESVTVGTILFPQEFSSSRNRLSSTGPSARLTFDNGGSAAALTIGGSGTGFVEFDIDAGVLLADDLIVSVNNIVGNSDYGALRLRRAWTGPGGFIKRGSGMVSLTGGDKIFTGSLHIEEGVVSITEPATPVFVSGLHVYDGGQLRLVSSGSLRTYPIGGGLTLAGSGRGDAIDDGEGQGKLGALRLETGSSHNLAIIPSPVHAAAEAGIHVAEATNVLELSGPLTGSGFVKSGGGTLRVSGDTGGLFGSIFIHTGAIDWQSHGDVRMVVNQNTRLLADGSLQAIVGAGEVIIDGSILRTQSMDGLHCHWILRGERVTLIETQHIAAPPLSMKIYVDPSGMNPASATGAIWMPGTALTDAFVSFPEISVYALDPAGDILFHGSNWRRMDAAGVSVIPQTRMIEGNSVDGEVLSIRLTDPPLTFAAWRAARFPDPVEFNNLAISGPNATPFGDNIPNLLRFALGVPDFYPHHHARLPVLEGIDGTANLRLLMPPVPLQGILYRVLKSEDLVTWQTLFDSREQTQPPAAVTHDGILLQLEVNGARFFRMVVEEIPAE